MREREEGGSRGSGGSLACSGGGWVAGSGQTSRRTGWRAGGGVRLAGLAPRDRTTWDCWLGKRPLGNLPLCLCLLGPPCLSISLSFVVRRRPSQLSGPNQPSLTSSCSARVPPTPPSASSRPLLCPPASFPACLWAPVSAHLLVPPAPHPVLVSVCQRGLSGHRPRGWEDSPCSLPSRDQRCCRERTGLTQSEWLLPGCTPGITWGATTASSTTLSSDPSAGNQARLEPVGFGSFPSGCSQPAPLLM